MFWGQPIKGGKSYTIPKGTTDILRLSNLAVNPNTKGSSTLFLQEGQNTPIIIATLTVGKIAHTVIDHYVNISNGIKLINKGTAEIHVSGYYDPSHEDLEDLDEADQMAHMRQEQEKLAQELAQEEANNAEAEDSEDELEAEDLAPAKPVKKLKGANKAQVKKAQKQLVEESEEELNEGDLEGLEDEDLEGLTAEELAELENMDDEELAALEAELAQEEASLGKRDEPAPEVSPFLP